MAFEPLLKKGARLARGQPTDKYWHAHTPTLSHICSGMYLVTFALMQICFLCMYTYIHIHSYLYFNKPLSTFALLFFVVFYFVYDFQFLFDFTCRSSVRRSISTSAPYTGMSRPASDSSTQEIYTHTMYVDNSISTWGCWSPGYFNPFLWARRVVSCIANHSL